MLCVVWLQKELEQLLDSGAYNDAQEVGTQLESWIIYTYHHPLLHICPP
jgi:hypothetical protein